MHWRKIQDCPPAVDCDCPEPTEAPAYVGQIVPTPCGGSSDSSGASSDSSESSPDPDDGCSGECTWTAGHNIWLPYYPLTWISSTGNCEPQNVCDCSVPMRSPEFVGDTQVTRCAVCRNCEHAWTGSSWTLVSPGINCALAGCSPCGAGPDWTPTGGPANVPSVIAACGVDLAIGGGGDSGESSV